MQRTKWKKNYNPSSEIQIYAP